VMNFSRARTMMYVIVPQSWVFIIPPAFSYFVMFIKETSLTSQIGAMELMSAGKYFNSIGISPLMAYGTCLLLYFALSYPLTLLGRRIEVLLKNRFKGNMAALSASNQ
jgi:polar amino acid transport system permease protein